MGSKVSVGPSSLNYTNILIVVPANKLPTANKQVRAQLRPNVNRPHVLVFRTVITSYESINNVLIKLIIIASQLSNGLIMMQ